MTSGLPRHWVLVAGGFHDHGGMDRANAALASYLLARGCRVTLVGHEIDDAYRLGGADCHPVPRPRSAAPLAESLLARKGLAVAARVTASFPDARVVVNGGNCPWPDINWVHAVHAAWPVRDDGSPAWIRLKHRAIKAMARRQERVALRMARLVVANSEATRRAIVSAGLAEPTHVRTIYLGTDPAWQPASPEERRRARAAFGVPDGDRVVAFVGAMGFDVNKGFDVLWHAWTRLAAGGSWNVTLLAAGGGGRLPFWQREIARAGLATRVRLLGHTTRVAELLAAADLLVSPVRYEAYGLNVQEALCRGAAVLVSQTAGIVERFDDEIAAQTLPDDVGPAELAARLRQWHADADGWKQRAAATASRLRARSWRDMAADFADLAAATPAATAPLT